MGREVQKQPQPPPQQQEEVSYTVEQLVAFNPYNPDILPDLENYVNEQVSSPSFPPSLPLSLYTAFGSISFICGIWLRCNLGVKGGNF